MQKKFEINQTKIKGGCQSGRKVITHNYKSDLPLVKIPIIYKKLSDKLDIPALPLTVVIIFFTLP